MTIYLISGAKGSGKTEFSNSLNRNKTHSYVDYAALKRDEPLVFPDRIFKLLEKAPSLICEGINDYELVKILRTRFGKRIIHYHLSVADMLPWEREHIANADFIVMSTQKAQRLMFSSTLPSALAGERSETDAPSAAGNSESGN